MSEAILKYLSRPRLNLLDIMGAIGLMLCWNNAAPWYGYVVTFIVFEGPSIFCEHYFWGTINGKKRS